VSKYSNTATRIYLDYMDVSGFLNSCSLDLKQELADVTCLSDAGPRRVAGNYDHSHKFTAFLDATDDGFDEKIFSLLDNNDHYVGECYGANAEGNIIYEGVVMLSDQPRSGAVGGAVLLNGTLEGTNGITRGFVIRNASITGNNDGTGRNVGSNSAGQTFAVVIRVLSGTFVTFDVSIQESSDNGAGDAYATIAGLSQTSITGPGVWRKTSTSALETWKRVKIENWNGTSAVLLVTCGTVKGT
jgi:hypothetical protein